MTVVITHQAKAYYPHREGQRYVRCIRPGYEYAWCIQDAMDKRYDLQQGTCEPGDLPANIRIAADRQRGFFPSYVAWPR